jgi:hypothetical protein
VPFQLQISDAEQAYLDALPLSPEARKRLDQFIDQGIASVSDKFRLDPANRPNPSGPFFVAQLILLDLWGDGRLHLLDFHVRDDTAPFGVLSIVYIDHTQGTP